MRLYPRALLGLEKTCGAPCGDIGLWFHAPLPEGCSPRSQKSAGRQTNKTTSENLSAGPGARYWTLVVVVEDLATGHWSLPTGRETFSRLGRPEPVPKRQQPFFRVTQRGALRQQVAKHGGVVGHDVVDAGLGETFTIRSPTPATRSVARVSDPPNAWIPRDRLRPAPRSR